MERNTSLSSIQEMAMKVGASLFTKEKAVAQSNAKLIDSMVETCHRVRPAEL